MPRPTLPMAASAVYGLALLSLAIAGLWLAFVIVACIGGPLTGVLYIRDARSNRARRAVA